MLYPQKYVPVVTVIKGIVGGIGAGSVGVIIIWLIDALTTGNFEMNEAQTAAIVAVAGAVWIAAKNFAKVKLGWNWLPVLVCAIALQGCATWSPAVGGKTEIETTFSDVVQGDSQNTQYNQKLKVPAGVEAKDLASMTYKWNPDESGEIAVSSDRNANTMGQAELLKAAFEANTQQTNLLLQALLGLGNLASPLVGQKIDVDAAARAQESVNKAQLQSMIADIVKQVIASQKPTTPPADAPTINLPTVGGNN